jgi:3-deoxy-D-manno-octulosonic-acid transferase
LVRPLIRRVLGDIDRLCVQTEDMARRFTLLGADPARITVTGSLKFDSLDVSTVPGRGRERVLRFFRISPGRPVLIAGSTSRGEEDAVIRAFNRLRMTTAGSNALLILAARHPERFGEVERLCRQEGLSTVRRSDLPIDKEPKVDAVILDTIGELAQLYQLATAVFVGGSLVPAGGHNILEPAVHGRPIVFGPHMDNFAEIARVFLAHGAAIQVRTPRELEDVVVSLIGDPVRRARLGAAASALIDANRGAKDKTLRVVVDVFPPRDRGGPAVVRPFRLVH